MTDARGHLLDEEDKQEQEQEQEQEEGGTHVAVDPQVPSKRTVGCASGIVFSSCCVAATHLTNSSLLNPRWMPDNLFLET